jgi:glycine/D-amino acid oxidase-like deaminating enzyme
MSDTRVIATTDVLVIGAGIYGCAVAYFLARFGVDVTVIDAGDVGGEASGANAGNLHLQLSPFTHADKSQAWIADFARTLPFFAEAMALWRRLPHELGADLELRCPGGIMVAETERELATLETKVALERANGLRIEMVAPPALRALAPYLSDRVLGASYCADEGMANALLAVTALADAARAAGARFVPNARVIAMTAQASGWRVATGAGAGAVDARRVVIAAGSASGDVAAMTGVELPMAHRVIQMIATEPCEPFVEHLVYHAEARLTLKQVANGNVLIGGGWTATRDAVFARPAVLGESLRGSLTVAARVVPRLADAAVIRTWAGPNIYTPDGRPTLGAIPGRDNLYAAVCNTYGFTLGPLCGRLVAETVAGRPASLDLSPFSPARFAAIDSPAPSSAR